MSKCQHKGCNVTMSHGEFCHRHEPVRCHLCNRVLDDLMGKNKEHGPNRCVISMEAYRALEIQLEACKRGMKVYEEKIAEQQEELNSHE